MPVKLVDKTKRQMHTARKIPEVLQGEISRE
jgi:hypothetical protein